MKRQKMLSFYVEALLMILIFVTVILVLTGVFGAARSQSAEAKRLSQAVTLAANAAEAVSAVDSLEVGLWDTESPRLYTLETARSGKAVQP